MFFQIDDQFQVNPKARALAEALLEDDFLGFAAMGLWAFTGSNVQAGLTDGVVTRADLARLTLNVQAATVLAERLVAVGLWHAPGHDCERCPEVAPGTWLYHDWFDMGYDTGKKVKVTRAKRKELKDPELIAQVWARDCVSPTDPLHGHCRYCGTEVYKHDHRGKRKWHLEHVNPAKALGVRNVVLACDDCNRLKGNRTPEAAGLTLRPQPTHSMPAQGDRQSAAQHPASAVDPGSSQDPAGAVDPQRDDADPQQPPSAESESSLTRSRPDPKPNGSEVSRTHARGRAGQAGQGRVSPGLGEVRQGAAGSGGAGQGTAGQGRRRRRGRRSGKNKPGPGASPPRQSPQPVQRRDPAHDAGAAPEVDVGGRFGSPWHGYAGKPTSDELVCDRHGLPAPCWKCQEVQS